MDAPKIIKLFMYRFHVMRYMPLVVSQVAFVSIQWIGLGRSCASELHLSNLWTLCFSCLNLFACALQSLVQLCGIKLCCSEWCNCVLNLNVCGDISVEFSCFGCGTILLKTPLRMFRVFCIFQWSNTSYSPKHSWYLYWQKAEPKMVELNFEESSIIQQLLMIKEKCLLFKTALEKSSSTHVATWHP